MAGRLTPPTGATFDHPFDGGWRPACRSARIRTGYREEVIRAGQWTHSHSAFVVPKLSPGVLGDDVEVLDSVYVHERGFVVLVLAIENAIEEILVRLLPVAVDKRTPVPSRLCGSLIADGLLVVVPGQKPNCKWCARQRD
jgi:hypothetical protein